LANTLENEKELQEIADRSPENRAWFDLALNVEGLARNSGVHAAGVIIADEPLRDIIPLSKQGKDQNITTQWDMSICEEFGLLKMDFLGLRTLTILDDAIKMVEKKTGESICLDDLPLDDPKTYELLREADTEGVFQLESSGMRRLLIQLKPDSYEDIVAVLALFRPGPLGSGLHEIYARRKHGQEKISFPHPILEEILSETYGLLIYQEQIMRVAQKMSGFSLNDADTLRKAMGKKKKELMDPFEGPFMDGASANEIPKEVSEEIWQTMVKFAEYGFNKSHSTAYAMVTYQAAWMKAHHPLEFYASSLTHEAFDSDKLHILVEDARKHDSQVRPPCVNRSEATFLVEENDAIRFGLSAIKGVGEGAAETLVHLREQQESSFFENYDEFLVVAVASNINKTTFEGLIKAGALDCFGAARVDLNDELESALAAAQARAKDRARGQAGLFDQERPSSDGSTRIFDPNSDPEEAHHAPRELSKEERKRTLTMEKESLGMYLTRHPLDPYRAILPGISSWDSKNVGELPDRAKVALVGVASHMEIQGTRKDPTRKFARFKIEDLKGSTSALAWPSTYEDFGEHLVEDFIGIFHGQIDHSGETPTMLIDRVEPLGEPEDLKLEGSLEIRIDGQTTILPQAKEFLEKNPGPSHVRFHYKLKDGTEKVIRADNDFSVRLSGELI
ncbi:MAG: DNA polymerase III subunit alpha, partial [Planctomycetes bacterium]|nr:DNA polymerase III subunit alpha [Planctomycetota bacterium]